MSESAKPVLGLVGGVGCGKSTVAQALARHGGWIINADQLGHEALRQPDLQQRVVARFGADIIDPEGAIDRKKLGAKVFADIKELHALEALVFPFIGERILEEIELAGHRHAVHFIVLDAAVMLEAGWSDACDKIIYVDAPETLRLERVRLNRGWDFAQFHSREAAQMSLEEKRRRADAVLDNAGPPSSLEEKTIAILRRWGLLAEN